MKIDKKRHGSGHLKITSSTMLSFTVTGTYITISHRAPLAWILFKLTSLLQVYLGSHGFYGEDGEQEGDGGPGGPVELVGKNEGRA